MARRRANRMRVAVELLGRGRQIRRALDEAGVVTETRGVGRGRRIYVVATGRVET